MNKFFKLFFILAFLGMIFGFCPKSEVEFFVPAVIKSEQSEIVKMKVSIKEGQGKIYIPLSPAVGISTQHSTKRAINYAFSKNSKNLSNCDVFIDFVELQNSSFIDGPSASLAIALATVAGLENLSYPSNAAITGEIFENGVVGAVGGILDKIQAAFKNNKTLFVAPRLQFYERLLISKFFENSTTIKIVEVDNFSEAYEVVFFNKTIDKSKTIFKDTSIPQNLSDKKVNQKEKLFLDLANKINEQLEQISLGSSNKNSQLYLDYFKNRTATNKILLNKGYYYTAANNAFLDLMDAKLLSQFSSSSPNTEKEFEVLKTCLESVSKNQINSEFYQENFELLAGAQARYMWAKNKLEKLQNISPSSLEEKYLILRETYSAQTWCFSSFYLLEKAKSIQKQKKLNLEQLTNYIQAKIENLDLLLQNSSSLNLEDAKLHLSYAKRLLEEKKLAGAFFDVAYSNALFKFELDKLNFGEKEIKQNLNLLYSKNFSTLWANLYAGQALYLIQTNPDSLENNLISYSVLLLAEAQEQFLSKAYDFTTEFSSSNQDLIQKNISINKDNFNSLTDFFVSIFIILSLFLLVAESFRK